jgi:hypothetical protein
MTPYPEIGTVRRSAWVAATRDGFIEIAAGLVFLLFGAVHAAGRPQFSGLCWMPALFVAPMKRLITTPRIGTARLRRTAGIWAVKAVLILVILAVMGYIVVAARTQSAAMDAWTRRYFAPVFGLSLALFPLAGAIGTGVRRYYGYAFLVAAGFSVLSFRRDGLTAVFLVIGTVLFLSGLAVLVRFLKDHPLPGEAAGGRGCGGEGGHD